MAVNRFVKRVTSTIWERDLRKTSSPVVVVFHVLRVFFVVLRDLSDGQLNLRAMSLVYTTLLSAVPLLAISLSVLKGFGVHNEFAPLLFDFLAPMGAQGREIAEKVLGFVDKTRVGILSSVGVVLLLFTVMSVMQKIEDALNYIWHVTENRSLSRRFADYLSVLLIGPVLIVASTGLSGAAMDNAIVARLSEFEPIGIFIRFGAILVPLMLAVAAFSFIYIFIPNTKVRPGAALVGGITAAILWKVAGWGFAIFIVSSGQYEAIYSAFATLIVFMLWLYTSWLILMIGASVAFYQQRPDYLSIQRDRANLSTRVKEKLALVIMHKFATEYYKTGAPLLLHQLTEDTGISSDLARVVVETLEQNGFIVRVSGESDHYLPGKPLDATPVSDVIAAIRRDGEDERANLGSLVHSPAVDRAAEALAESARAALAGVTLKNFAREEPGIPPKT